MVAAPFKKVAYPQSNECHYVSAQHLAEKGF